MLPNILVEVVNYLQRGARAWIEIAQEIESGNFNGQNLQEILSGLGLSWDSPFALSIQKILNQPLDDLHVNFMVEFPPGERAMDVKLTMRDSRVVAAVFRLVADYPNADIRGIPSAACIQQHLPKGRKPTRKEIEEAFKKCS